MTGKSPGKIGLNSPPPVNSGLSPESIREQVQKVVTSPTFSQSKKLVRFLSFIVEKTLLGQGEQINEYLIGVEVYERAASFDPQIDTIVRGEARRLRSKLRQYFDAQGLHDPIVIDVPKGAYVAVFRERDRGFLDRKAGQLISRYRLSEKLGEGGMGAVYLAEDTVLGRSVALKFLSESVLRDKERRARLVREAKAAAAIDHPNVCTVYEIDEVEGQPFIAMAFIKGQSLEDRIPEGPLELRDALDIACQLADGLQAAHQQGVVHRDLKPANVIITSGSDGARVKIIDFGLAQLSAASRLTAVSTPIGTDSYVSPEQMNGEVVDRRSDLWSLGVILYEMVTAKPPFRGDRREAVFYAIAHLAPEPMSGLRAGVPEELERIVSKCLEKDPARRYSDAAELRSELSRLLHALPGSRQVPHVSPLPEALLETSSFPKQSRRWMAFAATGVLVVVAATVGLMWLLQKKDAVRPPAEMKQLTFDSGLALHPAISPDGKYLAFASDRAGERNLDIWVQALPGGEPVRLTRDAADEDFPSFSPDSTKIAFQSERDGGIYSIPILGGDPRLLAQKGTQPRYSPDGRRLSFTVPDTAYGQPGLTTAVFLMPAEGGAVTEFRTGFFASSNPVWSPDASHLLYAGSNLHSASEVIRFQLNGAALGGAAWYIAPVSGGKLVQIEASAQFARFLPAFSLPLAWLRSNRILFSCASTDAVNLWVATLSPDNRRIIGVPEQLTFGAGQITDASVANNGAVVFALTAARPRLWEIPLDGTETRDKGNPMVAVTNRDFTYWPSLSDIGTLAYLARTSDKFNLWLRDLSSGKETLLASLEGDGNINRVSAYINRTGTQLAYTTWHGSKQVIYRIGAGGGTPEKICEDCGQLRSWSPDGKVMLSQERLFEGSKLVAVRINRIDVVSGRKTVLLEKGGFLFSPELSPDGHWVAFQARGTLAARREQLFLAPMSDGAAVEPERWVPITELKYFDANPLFSRDGKILYFNSDRDGFTCLWAVRLDPASKKPVGEAYPVKHFHGSPRFYSWYPVFGVGPDRIIISLEQVQSDLWMTQLPEN